ncbi:DNA-binding GntR family transcriptional regulator [Streptosporangium becharense]|uniref:DNA-binding GntR family transcriptional regulator n=1 Tax=Streptosporangium becharense TaxID=1816182 RepID=A0A7W9MFY7_9ACTN|nr:GntR family transcriptional regulator [Streptosporangium becharense]MBB2912256.1 DNA-binding GntR family transcriptional regulator [Streptosporangium becharense]MBB5818803.1 DNA-binding GntR family transcriptional regulator [Streptosporangium becharense]
MLDHDGDTHLYLQIAEIIRQRITEAALPSGHAVPSEADIRSEFGVARTTARKAMQILRDEGLVYTVQGEGTFVGPPDGGVRRPRRIPMYQQIAEDVAERIRGGDLRPRRPIPSETTLMQQYDVARETVRRAVGVLREQGWIYTVPQRGSYVSAEEEWPGR